MSVRKRTWKTRKGVLKHSFVLDYVDQHGKRHIETYKTEREAKKRAIDIGMAVKQGTHTAHSDSITVAQAGVNWLANGRATPLERSTLAEYEHVLTRHITPYLGMMKLSKLTAPDVVAFRNRLSSEPSPSGKKRSPRLIKRVIGYLAAILGDAMEAGFVAQNVALSLSSKKKRHRNKAAQARKLQVGVDIPTLQEITTLVGALKDNDHCRPLLLTAVFTGLRVSELRGLRWSDVDLVKGQLHVRQRADKFLEMGEPKSRAGNRTVPLLPSVQRALQVWRLACPASPMLDLVFPNAAGGVGTYHHVLRQVLEPAWLAAGVSVLVKDAEGKVVVDKRGEPVRIPKYSGLHCLRHFYASWLINRKVDGGLELPPKVVQERLGHATIGMTLDRYGHLFPQGDTSAEMAAAEKAFFG
jgi:integrase